jgi:hypothetical protein
MTKLYRCPICKRTERSQGLRFYVDRHQKPDVFVSDLLQREHTQYCVECADSRQRNFDNARRDAHDLAAAIDTFEKMPRPPNLSLYLANFVETVMAASASTRSNSCYQR